jgi:hypothetical protein
LDAHARSSHVLFGCGRTWVKIFHDSCRREVWAPFEEPSADSFQQGGNPRAAQRLMCEMDAVRLVSHRVGEASNAWGMGIGKNRAPQRWCGRTVLGGPFWDSNGRIHESVTRYCVPRKIITPLYCTMHLLQLNVTSHSALVKTQMPKSEAILRCGMMWPVRVTGRPSIDVTLVCGHDGVSICKRNLEWI